MARQLTPRQAQKLAGALTGLWARRLDRATMLAPAIVFSPHQDDETLGCGGTILKKRQMGASVRVVFMTDGTASPLTIPAAELKPLREREARAACQQLGIEPNSVTFMEFVDGHLSDETERAIERVTHYLALHPAGQVFVPYYQDRDPGLDHVATNQIVLSALQQLGIRSVVYEYPVWYWRWWPRARMPVRGSPGVWEMQPHSLLPNLRSLTDFGSCVEIDEVLDRKRAALSQHQSQLEGLNRIQSAAFVKWFFGKQELFHRHTLS
jgi:LmbE family N-acetylglucosaminyl deacetylase